MTQSSTSRSSNSSPPTSHVNWRQAARSRLFPASPRMPTAWRRRSWPSRVTTSTSSRLPSPTPSSPSSGITPPSSSRVTPSPCLGLTPYSCTTTRSWPSSATPPPPKTRTTCASWSARPTSTSPCSCSSSTIKSWGVRVEQERNKRGCCTWEYAWMYNKPGTIRIHTLLGGKEESVSVIHSVQGGVLEPDSRQYIISGWSLEYDGQFLGRRSHETYLDKFDGVIVDNGVCFLDVADMSRGVEDLPEMAQKHIKYGKQYWKLLKKQCKYHRGKSRDFPFNEIESLVMVDLNSYFEESEASIGYRSLLDKDDVRKTWMTKEDCRSSPADGACAFCTEDQKRQDHEGKLGLVALFDDYNLIVPENHDELGSHMYLLCPADIKAFNVLGWNAFWMGRNCAQVI
ncbi:hypothetical protein B0T18DRAFT_6384 [Schizothecium vesticola]|uniref:DUF7025 domain-containing protein n=1 Tax=Schizothecium vesticola TaxID=314040 RepID=A0AA40F8B5_9PEZI|nr:hypothetical protein B0T18DRAFT_6384 [Schizothecium vesticola]